MLSPDESRRLGVPAYLIIVGWGVAASEPSPGRVRVTESASVPGPGGGSHGASDYRASRTSWATQAAGPAGAQAARLCPWRHPAGHAALSHGTVTAGGQWARAVGPAPAESLAALATHC